MHREPDTIPPDTRARESAAEWVPLDTLRPWGDNPRKNDGEPVRKVAESIKRFGFGAPIVARKANGEIIAGHTRWKAAQSLGLDRVPVRFVDLDPADAHLLALADNRVAEAAEWEIPALLEQLSNYGLDAVAAAGWSQEDLAKLAADLDPGPTNEDEPQIDRAEELRKEWNVEVGQLWGLGEHRLLCGDSTKLEDVDRVMAGEKASVCLTDPPYGLDDSDTAKNDYATYDDTIGNLRQLIAGAIVPLIGQMRVVFTPGNKNQYEYPKPSWTMAWFCPAGVGRGPWGFCCWQPILCYGKDAKLASGKGSHPDALVHQEGPSSDAHPCAKPMKLWLWLLDRVSDRDDVVYEPFSGSGTTIIACEQLGRKCRAIEISPGYVAVALQRFKDATGEEPALMPRPT